MGLCQSTAEVERAEHERLRADDVKIDVPRGSTTNEPIFLEFEATNLAATFKLGDKLGEGAFAVVVEGVHRRTGKAYAIKCVNKKALPADDEQDLLEEVRILRALKHPNIIDIYQFYKQEKTHYYVVMEYMKGGELFDRIVQKSYYNEKEARDLCRILLDSVKYCHDRDVVHRDLKPENLLLTSMNDDANIKLADFGFAKFLDGGLVTTQCGTPGYVAPEILRNKPYGTSVDMWSLGVCIYILLGGYPPFHDENQTRLFRKIRAGVFKFHPEYWGSVSAEAKDLIQRLLTVDVKRRLTASEAIVHPWLLTKDVDLAARNLDKNLQQLKLFNARRKLRAAIKSVIAAQRWGVGADYD